MDKAIQTLDLVADSSSPEKSDGESDQDKIIDYYIIDQIKDLAQEDAEEFLSTLIVEYENNAQEAFVELDKAISDHNQTDIESQSHRLASSSLTVGAVKFSELCRQLEHCVNSMTIQEIEQKSLQIKKEFQRFLIALKKVM